MNDTIEQIQTKVQFLTADEAIGKIPEGSSIMVGGFGFPGMPRHLSRALVKREELRDLTLITNSLGSVSILNDLFEQNRIKKVVGSFFSTNKELVKANREGSVEIELLPQGTFTEAIRLGGAGIPAFFTPTAAGTDLARGKETRTYNGREHVLEQSLTADVAIIRAHKADKAGNLVYKKTAQNFNPAMATAAKLTIVEVDEIVEIGELDPDKIVTPFIFVDIVVKREEV
ncbi:MULTISPECIES: CoA transferase subunit A [Neobacillus]|uniref:CoA transferase subunit A n=1 Tax=Neobacillus rhizophilus TaxID=2833579 RepID=A0A942U1E0_9BACI|nr:MULTISPECIES: CoA transferase subunit A [Neobacillus]MBS4210982.1 CoA transferase subunit A [Neobacillus rhizophilus]MBU8917468.1 CoA transferase subunit A [Bacillus sp. FJAT-29953]